jgi:hypothetical protein
MESTKLKENESSNKPANSSYLLANTTSTSQSPHWQTLHDSKSSSQQLTTVNNSEQSSHVKGPGSGTKQHHITAKAGDHERED